MDARNDSRDLEVGLAAFFSGFGPVVEIASTAQERIDLYVATTFSVFSYFKENEGVISRIFADLLDPNGSHGQGTAFLRCFLNEVDVGGKKHIRQLAAYGNLTNCRVETEHSFTVSGRSRRIDIVLRFGDLWIAIENKPWAGEQADQVSEYIGYVHDSDPGACILYLSGDGEDAKTAPSNKTQYLTVPYGRQNDGPSVENWITECLAVSQADRVRWFLRDISDYIKSNFDREDDPEGKS